MASSQLSPRFVVFVVVSLITHLMELAGSGLFCHMLVQQAGLKTPWFSVAAGLIIIPLVAVQLASAVFLLRRKGESSTTCEVTATAVLHVLQLGFISRHFAILQETPLSCKRAEVMEMMMLRISFAFTSGCSLFVMQLYLWFADLHESSWTWAIYVSGIPTLLSITWALSTFRRCAPELDMDLLLVTWPGTLLKMLWRAGEILTRVIALGLFASLYTYWLFLVVGLHWLAMLVCVCVPVMTSIDWRTSGCARRTVFCIMTSFAYIFAFINTSAENAVFRYTFYYVVIFLENSILIAIWLVQSSSSEFSLNIPFVYVAAISFVMSIISMIVYYKFFHVASTKSPEARSCGSASCLTCQPGPASAHPPIPPRPGAAGNWLTQAVYCGQYYKHNAQDSLLDSVSERNSTVTVSSSHARLQQKLATIDDELKDYDSNNSKQNRKGKIDTTVSSIEENKKTPKDKSRKKGSKKRKGHLTTSESELSSARTDVDHSEDSGSQKRPVWLPSGDSNFANQLLTCSLDTFDTADTADDERSSVTTGSKACRKKTDSISPRDLVSKRGHKDAPYPGISLQRSGDHHWYSDGYSTDRTLDWPKMAGRSAQRKVWSSGNETGSECTQCCTCSHGDSEVSSIMRSAPSATESEQDSKIVHTKHNNHSSDHHTKSGSHHHHHHHHHHRHRSNKEDVSGSSKMQRLSKLSPRDLDTRLSPRDLQTKNSPREIEPTKDPKFKPHKSSRNEVLPSPASDPSYGPKAKRKHSPKRRIHGPSQRDRSTSQSKPNDHRKNDEPLDGPDAIRSLAQSEKLATDLLKSSAQSHQHKSKDRLSSQPSSTSDPRFSVRVMTTTPAEDILVLSDNSQLSSANPSNKVDTKEDETVRKSKDNSQLSENHEQTSGKSKRVITDSSSNSPRRKGDEIMDSSSDSKTRSVEQEAQNNNNQLNTSNSDKTGTQGEVIYENIWQVGHIGKQSKTKSSEDKTSSSSRERSSSRDAWYVCSESEDSALPPEVLSSNSDTDVSMEIVI